MGDEADALWDAEMIEEGLDMPMRQHPLDLPRPRPPVRRRNRVGEQPMQVPDIEQPKRADRLNITHALHKSLSKGKVTR